MRAPSLPTALTSQDPSAPFAALLRIKCIKIICSVHFPRPARLQALLLEELEGARAQQAQQAQRAEAQRAELAAALEAERAQHAAELAALAAASQAGGGPGARSPGAGALGQLPAGEAQTPGDGRAGRTQVGRQEEHSGVKKRKVFFLLSGKGCRPGLPRAGRAAPPVCAAAAGRKHRANALHWSPAHGRPGPPPLSFFSVCGLESCYPSFCKQNICRRQSPGRCLDPPYFPSLYVSCLLT